MNQHIIEELCQEAAAETLVYNLHYQRQARQRPTPSIPEITHMFCQDEPQVIEDQRDRDTLLIWGTVPDGRIGHVLCSYYPDYRVITAYFPGETEPHKWADSEYRTRRITTEA